MKTMQSESRLQQVMFDSWANRIFRNVANWSILLATMAFLISGIGNIWLGATKAVATIEFIHSAVKTTGAVVGTKDRSKSLHNTDSAPEDGNLRNGNAVVGLSARFSTIELKLPDGVTEQFEHDLGLLEPVPAKGDSVIVYYNPRQPTSVMLGGIVALWSLPAAYILLGVIFLSTGVALYSILGREALPRKVNIRMQAQIITLLANGRRLAAIALASRESGLDIAEATIYVERLQRKYYDDQSWEQNINSVIYRLPYKRPVAKSEYHTKSEYHSHVV